MNLSVHVLSLESQGHSHLFSYRPPVSVSALFPTNARSATSGRCALEVLQLSVQQEGEADMDVELLRKGLLAVKLKGEEEGRNKKGGDGKGGAASAGASANAEGEGLIMPG